jgi:hypothetical protein
VNNVHNDCYPPKGLAATRGFLAATGKTLGPGLKAQAERKPGCWSSSFSRIHAAGQALRLSPKFTKPQFLDEGLRPRIRPQSVSKIYEDGDRRDACPRCPAGCGRRCRAGI